MTAQTEGGGWMPIESAPKDEMILGAYYNQPRGMGRSEGELCRCWWQPEFDAFISSCRQMTMAPGYTIDGNASKLHSPVIETPTHWMPLPPAPDPHPERERKISREGAEDEGCGAGEVKRG